MYKHFLDISDYKKNELKNIIFFAKKIKNNQLKYSSLFQNKSLGMLFEKQSTRTRLSFAIGVQKFGGYVIELDYDKVGFGTRESTSDILKTLSQYLDVLMIRNNDHQEMIKLASLNVLPIVNGLSNFSHPCQVLSDIFTIEECLGKIENKTIVWMGDFNNVLISLIQAAEIFNFKLNVLIPTSILKNKSKLVDIKNLKFTTFFKDIDLAISNSDCIMTDVWISMVEKNIKNKKKLFKDYQVNDDIMKKAKKKTIFMHCLPAHRNEEVSNSVIDGKQSVVWQQAQNRMYVQQSILHHILNHVKK